MEWLLNHENDVDIDEPIQLVEDLHVSPATEVSLLPSSEPPRRKTNNLHMRKQRRRSASFAVTAKLISAFVFATRIVHFIFFLNPKFPVSSHLLCLYSSVCVRPVRKPHCWFFHEAAHLVRTNIGIILHFCDPWFLQSF